ncbi:hypothetical protein C8R45DRAFT_933796 [Mycena sanguinolenta]|nr:hypothetical protein C8R45DRAFT_933796 [Mycena sanguinolenta]
MVKKYVLDRIENPQVWVQYDVDLLGSVRTLKNGVHGCLFGDIQVENATGFGRLILEEHFSCVMFKEEVLGWDEKCTLSSLEINHNDSVMHIGSYEEEEEDWTSYRTSDTQESQQTRHAEGQEDRDHSYDGLRELPFAVGRTCLPSTASDNQYSKNIIDILDQGPNCDRSKPWMDNLWEKCTWDFEIVLPWYLEAISVKGDERMREY